MSNETIEDRVDFLEGEIIAAGDIAARLADAREAIGLIHSILNDLTKDLPNVLEYQEDLERLETLGQFL
jgi:hypothetical protein